MGEFTLDLIGSMQNILLIGNQNSSEQCSIFWIIKYPQAAEQKPCFCTYNSEDWVVI